MSTGTIHAEALPVPVLLTGTEARWETEKRMVWNERDHTSEECELVYEVSWIAEVGVWRRFLLSRRKVQR